MTKLSRCTYPMHLRGPVIRALLACLVLVVGSSFAFAQAGHLDPTFAKNGIFSDTFSTTNVFPTVVALQSDGKILVAGEIGNSGGLIRLNTNGSLDNSFGTGGVVLFKFRVIDNVVNGLAVQSDGKILVSGTGIPGGGDLFRLNPNGSSDTSFGNGGGIFFYPETPETILVQGDGKIVLIEGAFAGASSRMQRFTSSGQLDTTFGSGGTAPLLTGGFATLQSDGKFLVASLDRYTSTGSLDSTFGAAGQVAVLAPGPMALQSNGQIVTAGTVTTKISLSAGTTGFGVERFNPNGGIDGTFGTRGVAATSFPNEPQTGASAVAVQSNGEIVAAGVAGNGQNPATGSFALARYLSTGQLDTTFGTGGRVTTGFGSGNVAAISALAIQIDGKIVAVGNVNNGSFTVARYLAQ